MNTDSVPKKSQLPQFDESEIRIRKSYSWWDGPLSGLMEYREGVYWFQFVGTCSRCDDDSECACEDSGRHYFYVATPLTPDQLAAIESDYQNRDMRYEPNLAGTLPTGWFTDGRNQNFYAIVVHRCGCDGGDSCKCAILPKVPQ